MREQQEGYRSPVAKIEVPNGEVNAAKEMQMPSIEDLDVLLHESERVATIAAMSEKEIDEIIERRQELLRRLQTIDTILASRLLRVEKYNPLGNLKPSDYERLVQEGMIDEEKDQVDERGKVIMLSAKHFHELEEKIARFQSLEYLSADARVFLERLLKVRGFYHEILASKIEERQEEIAARREEIKNKVLEHYGKRIKELERLIAEIESNPRVIERLQMMAEKERQEAEARIESERKKIVQEATRYIQSLGARHANAFKRLGEILGDEKIAEKLIQALGEEDARKKQSVFNSVRSHLINAIIEGEGEKQLKDPKEILPLKMPSSIPYREAIDFLRFNETEKALRAAAEAGNQQVEKLLKQREQILKVDEVFRLLVGRKLITDRKTGEQRIGAFWAAFETRKKNDQEGITAARKKEREEAAKREAIFKEAAKEIIERGGFVVEVPIVREIRGNKVKVGEEKGVFRLEKKRSKVRVVRDPKTGREIEKGGNEYWEIVEIFGATGGLKVGATSPLDMSAFPQWFREGAKPYFVMRGKNFIERLTTQEK